MDEQNRTPDSTKSDVERLSELATLVVAAQDALSDDMITRLSSALSEGISLLDRLTRNDALMHFIRELDRPENQRFLLSLSNALSTTSRDITGEQAPKGGITGTYKLACNADTQEGLKLLSLFAKHLNKGMRDNNN